MTEKKATPEQKDLSGAANLALKLGTIVHSGVYRATGGRLLGRMGQSPILLLNTTGRKSGKKRATPLLYIVEGEDFVIIASKGGTPSHPAWYLNLKANPDASVEVGDRKVRVRAEEVEGEEKERLWKKMAEMYPTYDDYQKKTKREIPLLVLHPRE
jgi:deazaflavin-dependent oxidoreductase (nitroreductase family)